MFPNFLYFIFGYIRQRLIYIESRPAMFPNFIFFHFGHTRRSKMFPYYQFLIFGNTPKTCASPEKSRCAILEGLAPPEKPRSAIPEGSRAARKAPGRHSGRPDRQRRSQATRGVRQAKLLPTHRAQAMQKSSEKFKEMLINNIMLSLDQHL